MAKKNAKKANQKGPVETVKLGSGTEVPDPRRKYQGNDRLGERLRDAPPGGSGAAQP